MTVSRETFLEREIVELRQTIATLRLDSEALRHARTVDREHLVILRNALRDIGDGCADPSVRAADALYAATPEAARVALNMQRRPSGDTFGGLRLG